MFSRLLRLPEELRGRYDISSLEGIVHGAAPSPVPIKQAIIDWFGPIVTEYYGATESNGFTWCDSAQVAADPGTAGRPLLGELAHPRRGGRSPARLGVDGTVWFRGATAFDYFDDPVKTAESRTSNGETSTVGDVGHVDAEGYLYLTDRKSYVIISGGVNIYPQETENLLATDPAVLDVAVIGVPNDVLGEEVKAVVQANDPAQAGPVLEQELIAFCRARSPISSARGRSISSPSSPLADREALRTAASRQVLGRPPDLHRVRTSTLELTTPRGAPARLLAFLSRPGGRRVRRGGHRDVKDTAPRRRCWAPGTALSPTCR